MIMFRENLLGDGCYFGCIPKSVQLAEQSDTERGCQYLLSQPWTRSTFDQGNEERAKATEKMASVDHEELQKSKSQSSNYKGVLIG